MDQLFAALFQLFELNHLAFLFAGTMLGLVVGILPGMGGTSGLALVLPFVFTMEPSYALAMMIGVLAPTTTSDTFPAVLMGVPGTSGSQATVMDGFPLSKKGMAARALSAAFSASLLGGIFGAFILSISIFNSGYSFISRGDNSGTHKKEKNLWENAQIEISDYSGKWYKAA